MDALNDTRLTLTADDRLEIESGSDRATLAAPLLLKGVVIGVLGIGDLASQSFVTDEIALAQAFADQAAKAPDTGSRRRHGRSVALRSCSGGFNLGAIVDVHSELW